MVSGVQTGSSCAQPKRLRGQRDGPAKLDTSQLENTPNSHVVELWGFLIPYTGILILS